FALTPAGCDSTRPGKVLFVESTDESYVEIREGRGGYVMARPGRIESRLELERVRELHGDLNFICSTIHGPDNPRFVLESTNTRSYQVVYHYDHGERDQETLKVVADALNLSVTREEREVDAVTVRVAPGGHRLKPAAQGLPRRVEEVSLAEDRRWLLEGATMD